MVIRDLGILETLKAHITALAGLDAAYDLWRTRNYHSSFGSNTDIIDMLASTRYAAVTLPVDKIYGILGLCRHNLVPDYAKQAEQVFWESTVNAVREALADNETKKVHENMDFALISRILCSVDHDPEKYSDLPSWVSDWSKPRLMTLLAYSTHVRTFYRAGGSFGDKLDSNIMQVSDDGLCLLV